MLEFHTTAEIEAHNLLINAGVYSLDSKCNLVTRAADYILDLAEKIKNQRANLTMQLAGNRGSS